MEPMPKASLDQILSTIPSQNQQTLDQKINDVCLAEIARALIDWKSVCVSLGIAETEEVAIEEENSTVDGRRLAVLRKWRSKYGPTATYRNLAYCFYGADKLEMVEAVCQALGAPTGAINGQQQGNQVMGTASPPSATTTIENTKGTRTAYGAAGTCDETTLPQDLIARDEPSGTYSKVKADAPLDERFQSLDVDEDKLIEQTHDIQNEFNILFTKVRMLLATQKVTVDDLVFYLERVPGYTHISLFHTEISDLRQASNLTEVFRIAGNHCSWFNHSFLSDVIETFCRDNKEIKKAYQEYRLHLQKYCKHRVKKCPIKNGFGYGGKKDEKMIMKVDRMWDKIRIEQLEEAVFNLARILDVPRHTLHLCCAEKGCVQLILLVPNYIPDAVFPLTTEQEAAMRKMRVMELQCGTYRFSYQCDESTGCERQVASEARGKATARLQRWCQREQEGKQSERTKECDKGDYHNLMKACVEGDIKTVCSLVRKVYDPLKPPPPGKPPHYWACRQGRLEILRELIEKFNFDPKYVMEHGHTLLHVAITEGHCEVVRYLVSKHSLDPKQANNEGVTLLFIACDRGYLEVVRFLISDLGCDPKVHGSLGESLLHIACGSGYLNLAQYLVTEQRLDPSAVNNFGETPLHFASSSGCLDLVKYLIEQEGCNTTSIDRAGNTPLHVACQNGHVDIVQYLIYEQKCDIGIRNFAGYTLLHTACRFGREDVITDLLETKTIDLESKSEDGKTPIEIARKKGIIMKLIRSGARTKGIPEVLLQYKKQQPLDSLVHIYVLGHPSSGKTTLVAALKELRIPSRLMAKIMPRYHVKNVSPQTAGIISIQCETADFGKVLLFDFAGQSEYYASHAALLEHSSTLSTPLFLLVINLADSDTDVERCITYWLQFLESHHLPDTTPPHIIIIASHKDILKKQLPESYKAKISAFESFAKNRVILSTSLHFAGFFAIDCREPRKHHKLRQGITYSCKELRTDTEIDACCHVLSVFLLDMFRFQLSCTIAEVIKVGQMSDYPIPLNAERLCELAESLSDRMSILFLKNSQSLEKSWIILDIDSLLSKINGRIFAPQDFKEHCLEASRTGILSWSQIQTHFSDLDPALVVSFLGRLEFCNVVNDPEALQLINSGRSSPLHPQLLRGSSPHLSLSSSSFFSSSSSTSISSSSSTGIPAVTHHASSASTHTLNPSEANLHSLYQYAHIPDTHCQQPPSHPPTPHSIFHPPHGNQQPELYNPRHTYPIHLSRTCQQPSQPELSYPRHTYPLHLSRTCQQPSQPQPKEHSFHDTKPYIFFPGLISSEQPDNTVWMKDDSFSFYSGWCLLCRQQNQFFTPRFLQILLLRLAFGFAVSKHSAPLSGFHDLCTCERECTIWKNGLRWLDLNGIETIVEIVDECRAVIMFMRGKEGSEMSCVSLRSAVIQKILSVKEEYCHNLVTSECVIDPQQLKAQDIYPMIKSSLEDTMLYEVSLIARAVVHEQPYVWNRQNKRMMKVESLLYFEPYLQFGESLLGELYNEDQDLSQDFLYQLSTQLVCCDNPRVREFEKIFSSGRQSPIPPPYSSQAMYTAAALQISNPLMDVFNHYWERGEVTMGSFRSHLDKFSLFGGRNILELLHYPSHLDSTLSSSTCSGQSAISSV